jgi:hypothetical protein
MNLFSFAVPTFISVVGRTGGINHCSISDNKTPSVPLPADSVPSVVFSSLRDCRFVSFCMGFDFGMNKNYCP